MSRKHKHASRHAPRHTSTIPGEGNFTMIRGLCASTALWYNVSLASSLFPSQLPPLPKHAISEYVGLAYIREDRDFAFDGGSSACATMAAVRLMFEFKLMIFWSFHL